MKNFIKILSAVLLVTAINACTLQEATDSTPTGAISITAQTVQEQGATNVPDTKTTYSSTAEGLETHWVANTDKIGIFSPQAKPTVEDPAPTNNAAFTAQSSGTSSGFTGTMFWGGDVAHHFYAYYPYKSTYSGDQTAVPISLPSAQSQSAAGNTAHIGALDYMVAKHLAVPNGGAVNLEFNHVFAMIEFKIKGSGNLKGVSFTGAEPLAFNSGTIDLTQTPSTDPYSITKSYYSNNVIVMLTNSVTLSAEPVSIYMMILPGAQSNLDIALYDGSSWKYRTKAAPSGVFSRGKKYELSLNTGDEGWTEGTGTIASYFVDSRDDYQYSTVIIGSQVWMAKNLAYLPSVVGLATGSTTEPYRYVYGYNGTDVSAAKATSNYITYGVLYNWPAAMNGAASSTANPSGVQGICPTGWHLPSDAEWTQLTDYVGGTAAAGGKLKSTDTGDGIGQWKSPNTGATDEYGFTALPGGTRTYDGTFGYIGGYGFWWSSTEYNTTNAWTRPLYYNYDGVSRGYYAKDYGFSVRCLRD
ncbi:MAG: FISUMP domain-containing protein [Bacteroidales bacterium]|nr:FISUMP domain-containing protein [Bacteroidales bacterium]MDD3945170.1 FISUMP domain-containing protein [Bacteroidales bacterium]